MNLSIAAKLGVIAFASVAILAACNPDPIVPARTTFTVSPLDKSTAVAETSKVVLTYTAAMADSAKTSVVLKDGATVVPSTPVWDTAKKVLTVTPTSALGFSKVISVVVAASTDAAGTAVDAKTTTFTVKAATAGGALTATIVSTPGLDGTVASDSGVFLATDDSDTVTPGIQARAVARVGNTDTAQVKGFVSFDLSALPATLTADKIVSAKLVMVQREIPGGDVTPYTDLVTATDKMTVEDVSYGATLTKDAYTATGSKLGNAFSAFNTTTASDVNVLDAVKTDWTSKATNGARSQYRLSFPVGFTAANKSKSVRVNAGNAATVANASKLVITYNP